MGDGGLVMESNLEKQVRFLKIYAVAATLLCGVFLLTAFTLQNRPQKFQEITVERINVVEKDGSLRLVISNNERSPGPIERGKAFGYPGGSRGGLIFYNEEGTENGGLIFSGKKENGKVSAYGSLTFDQYDRDQTLALQYGDEDGKRRAGLAINDYSTDTTSLLFDQKWKAMEKLPDGSAKTETRQQLRQQGPKFRLFAGRGRSGSSLVQLGDGEGRIRLQLAVDLAGNAKIEFLDEKGNVTRRIPEAPAKTQ
jgi:hypothetical protein